MRRVSIDRAGGHERLRFVDGADLVPAAGDVVVETEAIGVNYADCVVRMGLYASAREFVGWPITPGFEFAGRVRAVGGDVHDLAVGAPVYGVTRFGGYATQVRVPRHQVFVRPEALTAVQAAAVPAVYLTAWFALYELAHPRAGHSVLVHSAAGGVGGALVQLAKRRGCRVVAVVGATHKIETARASGADEVIDKSREDLWSSAKRYAPHGYDVVLDANGVSTLRESYRHLGSPGKLVVYGFHSMLPRAGGRPNHAGLAWDWLRTPRFDPLSLTNENRSVMAFNLSYLFDRDEYLRAGMGDVEGWLRAGVLKPPPVRTYPFDRVADAHRDLESGQTVGKLVLVP